MAIKKFDSINDKLQVNQWICQESAFVEGGADRPARVTSVSGSRVYFAQPRGDDLESGKCTFKTVMYVADTHEEGLALYNLDKERRREVKETVQRVTQEINDRFNSRISQMLAPGSAPAPDAPQPEAEDAPTARRHRPR